jgi:hypothetical protein
MDPMIVPWDPWPGVTLLVLSLIWAARRRVRSDLAALLWASLEDRPD